MKRRINIPDIVIMLIISFITVVSLLPILITFNMSLSDRTSAALGQVVFYPRNFNLIAYEHLLDDARFFTAFGVSVRRVLLGTALNTLFSIFMAFPLSKDRKLFPARTVYVWFIVFNMLFHGGIVPTFMLVRNLGLLDTLWALVLPGAVNVFNTLILMNFFKGVPRALEESAIIDGARPFRILWRVYVPLAKACIATITLFAAVNHWNAFFDGLIYMNSSSKIPLQTYIQSLTVELSMEQMIYMDPEDIVRRMEVSNLTFNAAKVIISIVPIIAIYPFLQRYFVTGIVLGAVKE